MSDIKTDSNFVLTADRRYELVPQMRTYEQMPVVWVPHLMNLFQPNFKSKVCNTDKHGFRYTKNGSISIDYEGFQQAPGPKGILCGGSTAFGTGATSDDTSIASFLNNDSDITWFNFSSMGHTSTQELLRFQLHLPEVEHVVLLTGLNNLMIHTYSRFFSDIYGSVFSQSSFDLLNRASTNWQYAKYHLSQVKQAVIRRLVQASPISSNQEPRWELPDFESRYQDSIKILERDLDIWNMLSKHRGFSLRYMLQPVLAWTRKSLSPEESELLAIMNKIGGVRWAGQVRALSETYLRYREDTQRICQDNGIQWSDCNELLPSEDWLFCDRTHLTDLGQELTADIIRAAFENGRS